jgi:hypothetical protein
MKNQETKGAILIGVILVSYMIFNWVQTDKMIKATDEPTTYGGAAGKFDDRYVSEEDQKAIAEFDRKTIEEYWARQENS